eukprot:TRINITY_DN14872_c0_g1_i1.p1 TRINITY_DN14872_c0_g1~~TRINITY_DN14872_c0_g1_i1.p1  ORF type:complete len:426 (+),score=152.32 TRINITY_DN14872_c0_g1_i1:63-1280(+)
MGAAALLELLSFVGVAFVGALSFLSTGLPLHKEPWIMTTGLLAFTWAFSIILPGKDVALPLSLGSGASVERLRVKINGLFVFGLSLAAFFLGIFLNFWKGSVVADFFWELISVSYVITVILSIALAIKAKIAPTNLVKGSGVVSSLWRGAEVNPQIMGVDIKFLTRGKYQLISRSLLAISVMMKQYEQGEKDTGTEVHVSVPMMVYVLLTVVYTVDYLMSEEEETTTYGTVEDPLGPKSIWTHVVGGPLISSYPLIVLLQTDPSESISPPLTILVVLWFMFGLVVRRGSSTQKHDFKTKGPRAIIWSSVPLVMQSPDAKQRLLVCGWWSFLRHPNYYGDLSMAFSLSLLTFVAGFSVFHFVHPLLLLLSLLERSSRVEAHAHAKYGDLWTRYSRYVRTRFLPLFF